MKNNSTVRTKAIVPAAATMNQAGDRPKSSQIRAADLSIHVTARTTSDPISRNGNGSPRKINDQSRDRTLTPSVGWPAAKPATSVDSFLHSHHRLVTFRANLSVCNTNKNSRLRERAFVGQIFQARLWCQSTMSRSFASWSRST